MKAKILPGSVVFSKKGRDKDRCFVVLLSLDTDVVLMSDGDTRKLDHMKKKKLRHLSSRPVFFPDLVDMYQKGTLKDSDIRKALAPYRADTEQPEAAK